MIVTSISPTYIANCIKIDCEDGSSQLMCMLQGQTTSFKINSAPDYTPRIRFIDSAFKAQISCIAVQEDTMRMKMLCKLLVDEVSQGRVIVETKDREGRLVAITSPQLQDHRKTKKYDTVELAGKNFFKEIAAAFDTNLQTILEQIIAHNKQLNSPETQLEAAKKQLDRQIVIQKLPKKSFITGFISVIVKSLSDLFKTHSKVQGKFIANAREQARLSCEKQRTHRRKERRKKAEDKKLENLNADIKLQTHKLEALKHEQTVH